MNGWSLNIEQLQIALSGINVLLIITWISLFAWFVSALLKRRAVLRHGLLVAALVLILLSPLVCVWQQTASCGLLALPQDRVHPYVSTSQAAVPQVLGGLTIGADSGSPRRSRSSEDDSESSSPMGLTFEHAIPDSQHSSRMGMDDSVLQQDDFAAGLPQPIVSHQANTADESEPAPARSGWERGFIVVGMALICVWSIGALILLIRLSTGFYRLCSILRDAESNRDSQLQTQFVAVCQSLGYLQPAKLSWSSRVSGPISVGIWQPYVILPLNLADRLTSGEWREVLIHEVSHLKRCDTIVVFIQHLIGTLFWIHPSVHWLNRQLAQAREEICDNHVLVEITASSYSRTLLKLASAVQPLTPFPGAMGLFASRWKLERRIAGLLDRHRNLATRIGWRGRAVALLLPLIAGIMSIFGTIAIAIHADAASESEQPIAATQPTNASKVRDAEIDQNWPAPIDDGMLSLNLIVRMPDGTAATNAKITSYSHLRSQIQSLSTDATGRVTIRDVFGHGANIHATTKDGQLQGTLKITAIDARSKLALPITLTLQPAIEHHVRVTAEGKPALGTSITIYGTCFEIGGITGADGVATLALPANERVSGVSAWHREKGIAGIASPRGYQPEPTTSLSLDPVAPTSVRVLDERGNAVPHVELCATSLYFSDARADDERQLTTASLPGATIRTNAEGRSSFSEIPRDRIAQIHFESLSTTWKVDRVEPMTATNRAMTVHVRRLKPATGRVVMPPGVSPAGLLVSGDGFGSQDNHYGDNLVSRVRQDGTFEYRVPTSHGYCVAISDHEWFSAPWTGLILKTFDAEPAEISLQAQRSVPIKVRVTQGPDRKPYHDAMVVLGRDKSFRFTTESGEKVNAMGSMANLLEVDANGEVQSGAPLGNVRVSAGSGLWNEMKRIKVSANQPVEVEFHCAAPVSVEKRELMARMMHDGSPYRPSQALRTYAWTDFPPDEIDRGGATLIAQRASKSHRPSLRSDQTVAVSLTDDDVKILAVDEDAKLAGVVKITKDRPAGTLEMLPDATLQGTLVDENGEPLKGREISMMIGGTAFILLSSTARTDANGKFSLSAIPSSLPIRLSLKSTEAHEEDYRIFGEFLFEAGELRENTNVRAQQITKDGGPKVHKAAKPQPLSQRLLSPLRDARVSGMNVLILLQGDESELTSKLTARILGEEDDEEEDEDEAAASEKLATKISPAYFYLPVRVSKKSANNDLAFLKQQRLPQPQNDEIVLIALDASQKVLGTQELSVGETERSTKLANEFLHQHKPAYEDARSQLQDARTLAAKSNRRVWITACGPRCAPCFQLAHWLESQRELLEKDYVFVKLMCGLQDNAEKINDEIGGRRQGIPWIVITESDGRILITSENQTGNMGMPSSLEDIRHLRKMLEQTARHLTSDQIEKLTKSLQD